MSYIKRLRGAAAKFRGTVEDDSVGGWKRYQVCAPLGFRWADGAHALVCTWEPNQRISGWADEAVKDTIERMAGGVEMCAPDCDACEDLRDAEDGGRYGQGTS